MGALNMRERITLDGFLFSKTKEHWSRRSGEEARVWKSPCREALGTNKQLQGSGEGSAEGGGNDRWI